MKMRKILMMILTSALGLGAWGVTVTTEADLRTAIANGGTVTLGGNIALTQGEIAVANTVTLDLGTNFISAASGNIFQVAPNGNFTVNADATTPGGLTVGTTNACVYTAYGLGTGPRTIVLNGGVFTGNCLFNFGAEAAANVLKRYGISPDGAGSGERADPTSVTINGGVFQGGYAQGNVGEYRCYYFTVNGGTFEKGLDCADTTTCSIGVTTTCKAYFKGGRYKNRYPTFRMKWNGLSTVDDPGKVFIGTETHTNVYYYAGGYYVNAPDYSACAGTGTFFGADVQGVSVFTYLATQCCQRWYNHSKVWYFLTQADAESVGVTDFTPINGSSGIVQPQIAVAAAQVTASPVLTKSSSVRSAARLLSAASSDVPLAKGNSENDELKGSAELDGSLDPAVTVSSIADYASDFQTAQLQGQISQYEGEDFWSRDDMDACYVFSGDKDNDYSAYYLVAKLDKAVEQGSLKFYIGVGVRQGRALVYARELGSLDANNEYVLTTDDDMELNQYFSVDPWVATVDFPFLVAVKDASGNNSGTAVTVELRKSEDGSAVASFTHVIAIAGQPAVDGSFTEYTQVNGANAHWGEYDSFLKNDVGTYMGIVYSETRRTLEAAFKNIENVSETGLENVSIAAGEGATQQKWVQIEWHGLVGIRDGYPMTTLAFGITPQLRTITESGTTTRIITNEEIGGKTITFRLPLTDDFTAKARVVHTSEGYPTERWIADVGGEAGARYVEISTTHFSTFTVSPVSANVATTSVQASNLFGAIEVTGGAANMYVAVPFEGFGSAGAARAASNVVHAANLANGAKMFAWDKSGDKYNVYEVEDGAWMAPTKVTVTAEGKTVVENAPLDFGVAAGTGVILQRPNSSGTVYVYGQIPSAAEPVTFGAGQTLVSPPYTNATVEVGGVKYVDLNAAKWTGVKGTTLKRLVGRQDADYVQFRNSNGDFVKYYYLDGAGGGWGVTPTEEARFGELVKNGQALVPVGTAFWYYSTGGGAKVEWK